MKQGYVYILTNYENSVLYIGVTSNLPRRVYEHKNKLCEGFTNNYHLSKLVWYECTDDMYSAITREKQLKAGSRKKKIQLIESINKDWNDLYSEIAG